MARRGEKGDRKKKGKQVTLFGGFLHSPTGKKEKMVQKRKEKGKGWDHMLSLLVSREKKKSDKRMKEGRKSTDIVHFPFSAGV